MAGTVSLQPCRPAQPERASPALCALRGALRGLSVSGRGGVRGSLVVEGVRGSLCLVVGE